MLALQQAVAVSHNTGRSAKRFTRKITESGGVRYMGNRCSTATAKAAQDFSGALLSQIQLWWPQLSLRRRLIIKIAATAELPERTGEVFVGDEFRQADRFYLDVVIRLHADDEAMLLASVLVFEKHSLTLMQAELNALDLCSLCVVTAAECAR